MRGLTLRQSGPSIELTWSRPLRRENGSPIDSALTYKVLARALETAGTGKRETGNVLLAPEALDLLVRHADGDARRGWSFRAPGHGGIDWEAFIRGLNEIGYEGPLSVEFKDAGMNREFGAEEACKFVSRLDFEPARPDSPF